MPIINTSNIDNSNTFIKSVIYDIPSFYKKRNVLYTKYSNIIIDCNQRSVEYIADLIYNRLL